MLITKFVQNTLTMDQEFSKIAFELFSSVVYFNRFYGELKRLDLFYPSIFGLIKNPTDCMKVKKAMNLSVAARINAGVSLRATYLNHVKNDLNRINELQDAMNEIIKLIEMLNNMLGKITDEARKNIIPVLNNYVTTIQQFHFDDNLSNIIHKEFKSLGFSQTR